MNRRIQVIVTAINERPIRRLVTEKRRVLFETYEKAELADLPAERFAFFTEKVITQALAKAVGL
jgi:phosphopantetheinyl transferase (holo-ACP synthase)